MLRNILWMGAIFGACILGGGCIGTSRHMINSLPDSSPLQPGDEVEVNIAFRTVVGAKGEIQLLGGSIKVEGLTPEKASLDLTTRDAVNGAKYVNIRRLRLVQKNRVGSETIY